MSNTPLTAAFPYPGGKRGAAAKVWERFGVVENYIEPFAGSLAVLLANPNGAAQREIVGDLDGMVTNAWRAIRHAPEETAWWACYPSSHLDLIARKAWLLKELPQLVESLVGDPFYYDSQLAGWWLWCVSNSIDLKIGEGDESAIPFVGAQQAGKGVSAQRNMDTSIPHVKDSGGQGVQAQRKDTATSRPHVEYGASGQGVQMQRKVDKRIPHLERDGSGVGVQIQRRDMGRQYPNTPNTTVAPEIEQIRLPNEQAVKVWLQRLSERLARVYLLCNSWEGTISKHMVKCRNAKGVTGIFLDPPYNTQGRQDGIYSFDSLSVADDVFKKAMAISEDYGDNVRIAFCGYINDYPDMPSEWERVIWRTAQSRGGKVDKAHDRTECIWFSPSCQSPASQSALF